MIDLTHPCLTLPLISAIGVITSLAGIAVIEGIMKREETDEKVHFLATGKGLFILLSGVVVLWLLPLGLLFWKQPGGVGEAGDMFGSVTALFSGLAFAGLIAALFTQRQELITQRKELELQRKELELSRREYKLQRFENTLFAMLELFNGHVQSLEDSRIEHVGTGVPGHFTSKETLISGRAVLSHYANKVTDQIHEISLDDTLESEGLIQGDLDGVREGYLQIYTEEFEQNLSPYFRLLYNTFRHIDTAELSFNDEGVLDAETNVKLQQKYAKIVRAYFSTAEIRLLMFNCVTEMGEDFLPWIKKYQLLKHLRFDDAWENPALIEYYGKEAFGERWKKLILAKNRDFDAQEWPKM